MKRKYYFMVLGVLLLLSSVFATSNLLPIKSEAFSSASDTKIKETDLTVIVQEVFPDLKIIKFDLEKNTILGETYYKLMTQKKDGTKGHLLIDSDSGNIIRFAFENNYSSNMYKNAKNKMLSSEIREKHADIFPSSNEYVLTKERKDSEHEISYFYKRFVDGIEIDCDSISLVFDRYFGSLVAYSKHHHIDIPSLDAKISAEKAEDIAYERIASEDFYLNGKKNSELIVDTDYDGKLRLMWKVKLYSDKPFKEYYYIVLVDAIEGNVMLVDALG